MLVQFVEDGVLEVVQGLKVEMESGESAQEEFPIQGARCEAPYDKGYYTAVVIYASSKCLH